jgi:hypothetical protein
MFHCIQSNKKRRKYISMDLLLTLFLEKNQEKAEMR